MIGSYSSFSTLNLKEEGAKHGALFSVSFWILFFLLSLDAYIGSRIWVCLYLHVHVWRCAHTLEQVWRSEDGLQECVLPTVWVPETELRSSNLTEGTQPYPLIHLPSPTFGDRILFQNTIVEACFELPTFFLPPPKCWDYSHMLPRPVHTILGIELLPCACQVSNLLTELHPQLLDVLKCPLSNR